MVILLMIISGYVAVNLLLGNGPRWPAITLYWVVLTIKNALDWGKKWTKKGKDMTSKQR